MFVTSTTGQCGELNMIVDGGIAKISDETRIVNTTITVTCYDGYYLSEENTLTCGEDGNWNTPSLSSSSCLPRELFTELLLILGGVPLRKGFLNILVRQQALVSLQIACDAPQELSSIARAVTPCGKIRVLLRAG